MFYPLIFSNMSLRVRCLGGNSTTQVMMQHQISAWVLTWCWYLVAVLIMHQMCDSPQIYVSFIAQYKAECIIYQLSLDQAAVAADNQSVEQRWHKKEASLPCWGSIFFYSSSGLDASKFRIIQFWHLERHYAVFFQRDFHLQHKRNPPPHQKKKTL